MEVGGQQEHTETFAVNLSDPHPVAGTEEERSENLDCAAKLGQSDRE